MLVAVLPFNRNCNQNGIILYCGMILTYSKHVYTLALTMLKMAGHMSSQNLSMVTV